MLAVTKGSTKARDWGNLNNNQQTFNATSENLTNIYTDKRQHRGISHVLLSLRETQWNGRLWPLNSDNGRLPGYDIQCLWFCSLSSCLVGVDDDDKATEQALVWTEQALVWTERALVELQNQGLAVAIETQTSTFWNVTEVPVVSIRSIPGDPCDTLLQR